MRRAELGWATVGEDASANELCERVAALLGKPAATLGADVRDGQPRRAADVLPARGARRARGRLAHPHLGGERDRGDRAAPAVPALRPGRADGSRRGRGADRRARRGAARAREHAYAGGRHDPLPRADRGARSGREAARLPGPRRRRAARECGRRARGSPRRPRRAGELRRHVAQQEPVGAVRRRARRQRGGRRPGARDVAPPRRLELPPGRHRRGGRARRARHDARPGRRRPPPRARAGRRAGRDPGP